jgi:hypothetical protein
MVVRAKEREVNEQAQRQAMAELAGWKFSGDPDLDNQIKGFTRPESWVLRPDGEPVGHGAVPDYPHDGDAARAVARKLPLHTKEAFVRELQIVCARGEEDEHWLGNLVLCSPAEITEAVLRAAGKWKEG